MLALPSLYNAILDAAEDRALPHLRTVIVAGEACPARLVERHLGLRPETRLYNEYGPTEATVWSTVAECDTAREIVPIGKPVPGYRVYILDASLAVAPLGTPGELYIAGPGVARGYLDRPAITAAAFLPDPFSTAAGGRMYRTGDAALRRADGTIEFLGRVDNQVKIRGHRIELGEIEEVLRTDNEIVETVVVAHEESPGDARLIAYVVAPSKSAAARLSMRAFLQTRLPEYMIPARFLFLDALPRTPNGKVDRLNLPLPDAGRADLGKRFVAPRNEVESTLAAIWSEVLRVEQVGVEDDFFDLGGDSILSIQILARAKQAGLRFLPAQLFQQRTIAALAPLAEGVRVPAPEAEALSANATGLSDSEVDTFLDRVAARMNAAG
jgi:aryl carrier-like protein